LEKIAEWNFPKPHFHLKFLTKQPQYTQAVLKFPKLNTQAQQREAVVQGRSLSATV
jgi:hypothetical protein